jgi:UDP-N-acetylglucosamine--N-acetylmuramyl-(pentapeptide) pyrophosphoryl-undecaprenol N-acetylglucosamine transferase
MTTLLTCSAGGHLKQLLQLLPRFNLDDDVMWMTFDTALSRSLLANFEVQMVDYVAPREVGALFRVGRQVNRICRERKIDRVISTGAGLALSGFLPVLARGGKCHYIESATRVATPSMTGSIVDKIPGIRRYAQYPTWAARKWMYAGSVLDGFERRSVESPVDVTKIVVTVGTTESYGFRRLIERVATIAGPEVEVLWQTGATDVTGLDIDARESVPAGELKQAISEADVVISHCGTGSVLTALECGKTPVLVPRLARFDEHYDDHQLQLAGEIGRRNLGVVGDASELNWDDVVSAASTQVDTVAVPPPFQLAE